MKKLNYLLAGLAVCALASCTNDEPNGGGTTDGPKGDLAYMNIIIEAANQGRSTIAGDYQPSWDNAKEHEVTDVKFYFFDENGVKAEVEASWTNPEFDKKGGNVEYIGKKSVLVLEGLKDKGYPKYMLTVLNLGENWVCPNTLKEAAEQLQDLRTDGKFVMTTSSYFNDTETTVKNHEDFGADNLATYYATTLTADDFFISAEAAQTAGNTVEVYVERLAAKVSLNITAPETSEGSGIYPLAQTLGGGDNTGDEALESQLYLKVMGWNITATAKQSYLCKQLDNAWKTDAKLNAWKWNKPADRRSFFGVAATWGSDDTDGNNAKLNYINNAQTTAKQPGTADDDAHVAYCYENTSAANLLYLQGDQILTPNYPNTTYILLDTQVGKMVNGVFTPVDLVTFRGLLYTKEGYMNYILNKVKVAGKLNYHYAKTTETKNEEGEVISTTTETVQVDPAILTWISKDNGEYSECSVKLDETALKGDLYEKKDDGSYVAYADQAAAKAALAAAIVEAQDSEHPAIGHKDGRSSYNIAIEHLGASVDGATAKDLGYYGVVRNHWYQVEVSKFSRVGNGIFQPDNDKITVTPPTDPQTPLYYVAAKVNILSWKLVHQSTEL